MAFKGYTLQQSSYTVPTHALSETEVSNRNITDIKTIKLVTCEQF